MNASDINIFLRNNTGNKDKESLIDGFVVRTRVFNNILSEIKLSKSDKPEQSYLIIGQRGAGKTTLLYRLKYAIEDDSVLNKHIIPIMFSEEQYNLMELFDLWYAISESLEEYNGFSNMVSEVNTLTSRTTFKEEAVYELIEGHLIQNSKKIIIFLENIDVFFKKIGVAGQKRLREILTTSRNIRLICSATTHFDSVISYSDPFYEFFKIIRLDGLNKTESRKLLLKLAEQNHEKEQIQQILTNNPKRLESLRRLTAGNPRIISYLFQIFLDNENGRAIIDLYKLLDDITYLYKAELDQLSPQQQKIIDVIARGWDAVSTREIAAQTNIDSKHVSSILKALEKNQVVESVSTRTKNHLYRLKDRFLNIWYLMRFGKKREKQNVIWLVRFYDTWCDRSELSKRISLHIDNLKNGNYDINAALDMGNVFLSCENVSPAARYDLYKTTKSLLPKSLVKDLREISLFNTIRGLIKDRNFVKAEELLGEMERDEKYYILLGWLYLRKGEFDRVLETQLEIYKINNSPENAVKVGRAYEILLDQPEQAVEYYKMALDQEYWKAAFLLGQLFIEEFEDSSKSEYYHKLAISHGVNESLLALAKVKLKANELKESMDLAETAIQLGQSKAYNLLAKIYAREGDYEKAISSYNSGIAAGDSRAALNLGKLYMKGEFEDLDRAEGLFKQAIRMGDSKGNYHLGRLYLVKDQVSLAIEVLKRSAGKDADSAHLLGHIFSDEGDIEKSEYFFLKSLNHGMLTSLMCMFETAFKAKRNERKEFILLKFEEKVDLIEDYPLMLVEFCKLLVWNGRYEEAVTRFLNIEESVIQLLNKSHNEDRLQGVVKLLTSFFILLISRTQYNSALSIFEKEPEMKQVLKPIYFALMNFMVEQYPNEFLKAGDELKETVGEVLEQIRYFKETY